MEKYFCFLLFIFLFFTGCVSQKYCVKESDLCGLIVDENNKPVSDFLIICESNPKDSKTAYTNQSGIFMIPDLLPGKYKISGKKNNFAKIEEKDFVFDGIHSFYCCQVLSLNALLDKVDKYIEEKEFKKALDFINQIDIPESGSCCELILLYKVFLYKKIEGTA